MKLAIFAAAALAVGMTVGVAYADNDGINNGAVTLAVLGDWPYSQNLLDRADLLINSVNSDPSVNMVVHVGDIHSGSMPCTGAGFLPVSSIPAGASPGWNQSVYNVFQKFNKPMVYTPGDNEWADCHKTKQFASGSPAKELASVRQLFFARPGHTLGLTDRQVYSQGQNFDPAFPTDAQFVENVIWMDANTVFVTLNIPGGSNDDQDTWTNGFEDVAAHTADRTLRPAADLRWLNTAFAAAASNHADAVVVITQADMWDPAAATLTNYTPYVQSLASHTLAFGKPVLLINGDTHLFFSDKPLADPTSATGLIHHTPAVPNLTRIVVQGSTNPPAEWLRLTVDTRKAQPFSWTNVAYCAHPDVSCP
jgi:hypothetical protein